MKFGNHYPKWKIVLSSPVTIIVLLVIIFALIRSVYNVDKKVAVIDEKLSNANTEYGKLVSREQTLKQKVDFLSTDDGKEAELRAKYKAVAEGEKVAVILEDESSSSATTTARITQNISWWQKILGLIGLY